MTVSVRMNPLLENELEQAAKRQGVSKSQFVIDAVERALGRKEPGALLLQVRQEFAEYRVDASPKVTASVVENASSDRPYKQKIKDLLQTKHEARLADWQVFQDEQAAAQKAENKAGKKGART
jgi:hypothetical protein